MTAKDDLKALIAGISDFTAWTHANRIRLFAWVQHSLRKKDRFSTADINWCYEALDHNKTNVSQYLSDMERRKELLRDSRGLYLEGSLRGQYDMKYGGHETTIALSKLLHDLPGKISDEAEKLFLSEAITCYRHRAFRAAIVMVWNLTYDHLLNWILKDASRTAAFQASVAGRVGPRKAANINIARREDFEDLKESETIDICGSGGLFASNNTKKILEIQLTKRNMAAHPSLVVIGAPQAEDTVSSLINDVVLTLK